MVFLQKGQMITYVDYLSQNLNNKSETDVIYFDFSKAFDSVNHDIILKKLKEQYDINGYLLQFIKEYLKDRKQAIIIDGKFSSFSSVQSGVPQGSILGPLLFVLFINDIVNVISKDTNILLYADDMKIFREIRCANDHTTLQSDIDSLEHWAQVNKMIFHPDKCKVLHCSLKHNHSNGERQYTLGNTPLDPTYEEKDLGVIILPNLKWNRQHTKLLNKASQKLGLLRRNCSFSNNTNHRRILYLAIIRSQFEHCSQIWRPVSKTHIEKFEARQKKGIKWILNENFCYYSKEQYFDKLKSLDILPLDQKFDMNDLVLFHRIFYFPTPFLKLPNYLIQNNTRDQTSVYATRSSENSDDLQFKCNVFPRIDNFKHQFFYRAFEKWNALPFEIREMYNPAIYKTKLKEHLWTLAEYTIVVI